MPGERSDPRGDGPAQLDALGELRRWEDFGATWRVVTRDACGVVISLRRCDGGEEAAQLRSSDPRLLAYVGDRVSSE